MTDQRSLSIELNSIRDRFALDLAGQSNERARERVRALADDLICDVLRAVRTALIGEIGQALRATLGKRPGESAHGADREALPAPRRRRPPGAASGRRPATLAPALATGTKLGSLELQAQAGDAFAITTPSALLDAAADDPRPARAAGSPALEPDGDNQPTDGARQPIVLRDGEQLLRSRGSGIVIRRAARMSSVL